MKIASWNIAGGRKINSLRHMDYGEEDLPYFTKQLKAINPDIVCLQESHTNPSRKIAQEIGNLLGLNHCLNSPASPSHVDPDYQLGLAIISKLPFDKVEEIFYPDPLFSLYWPDGRKADTHHKLLQKVRFESLTVTNTQMLPLKLFGHSYEVGEGQNLAAKIDEILQTTQPPAIICGDFNFDNPLEIYSKFAKKLAPIDCLPDKSTRPSADGRKKAPDHIYIVGELSIKDSGIIETQTDHFLCWAEIL